MAATMKKQGEAKEEIHYLDYHINFLNEQMEKQKGGGGYVDTGNIRAMSSAMKLYIKEAETRELNLREQIYQLERLKDKNEERLLKLSEANEKEKDIFEKKMSTQSIQNEEKINELEKVIKEKGDGLISLRNEHEKLLVRFTKLNQDLASQYNNAKIKEGHMKEELEHIRKERNLVNLEVGKLEEEISRYSEVISTLKGAELSIRNEASEKTQIITSMEEKMKDLKEQGKQVKCNFEKAEKRNAECLTKLQQSQNENALLEKTLREFVEKLSSQSQELNQSRESNISLEDELKKVRTENEMQDKLITDLGQRIEFLNENVRESELRDCNLSMKFRSCIDQMQAMENKLTETQQMLSNEKNMKSDAEKGEDNARSEVRRLKCDAERLCQQLSISQNRCAKYEHEKEELVADIKRINEKNSAHVLEMEGQLSKEHNRNVQLEYEKEQKVAYLHRLQEEVNENIKAAVSIEKVNEIFSAELDKMAMICQDVEKYKRENAELQDKLTKMKDELSKKSKLLETSRRKGKEECDNLKKNMDALKKIIRRAK